MAELKKLLSALIKGNGSFEQVNAAVQRYLARSPEKAFLVAKLLKAARDAGLPHPMYVSLSGNVAAKIATGPDPDATIFAVDDGPEIFDRTALAHNEPFPDTDPTPQTGSRGDATVVTTGGHEAKTNLDSSQLVDEKAEILASGAYVSGEPTEMEAALDDDATYINPGIDRSGGNGAAHTDATKINSATADPTSLNTDATEKTVAIAAEVDFDLYADEGLSSAETADPDTGANWPTIIGQRSTGRARVFRQGDHLRNRFQLMCELGEGGMGAVWKGKDLLKEEARDRNPFVAIKLLQGDFKDHPEAFIALQRETAKQQRLAHPNIATVYDFDRDDSTNTVFMTMEVLEGQPLDAFIRKLPRGGLAVDNAMPLIEQLCNGLSYAHSHGLVHSDLKPGNCFFTKDGTIKLLDFGIARASKTKADADGETTLFDPSELGALTPTYATVEMFEGIDPDPRDDIYALSIMTYQLLTGRHPYGKKAAPKARELGLKPESISKLNKRQNKALMRGLAFEREHRTPTVEEFFDSVRPKKSRAPMIIAASLAAMVIIGVGAYNPVADLISHYRREQMMSIIEQPGIEKIRQGLDVAPNFEELRTAVSSYEVEVKNRQLEIALRKLFESTGDIDVAATRASMEKLKGDIPDRYPGLRQEFAETRGNQILGLANSKDLRISSLDRRMDEYRAMFPQEAPKLHKTVAMIVEKRIRAVQISSASDLESLSVPLTEFRAFSFKNYASLSKDLSSQIARQIRSLEKTDKFAAVALLEASINQFGKGPFRSIDIELPMN